MWHDCVTDRVDVEGVGAYEGDSVLQVVVLDPVLVVLVGHHGQSQGAHRVLAQIGQPHLQAHSVTHVTVGNDIAVTWLPVHQHIWKHRRTERESEMGGKGGSAGLEGETRLLSHTRRMKQNWRNEDLQSWTFMGSSVSIPTSFIFIKSPPGH